MSGGSMSYNQHYINDIVEVIKDAIYNNDKPNDYGDINSYSEETIRKFEMAIVMLKKSYIYAQRIDWLLSGDDGEDDFHNRLREDLLND